VARCIIAKVPLQLCHNSPTQEIGDIGKKNLVVYLNVEDKARAKDITEKGESQSIANMVQKKPCGKNKGNNKPSFSKHAKTTNFKVEYKRLN
jgi:hypothetical protein